KANRQILKPCDLKDLEPEVSNQGTRNYIPVQEACTKILKDLGELVTRSHSPEVVIIPETLKFKKGIKIKKEALRETENLKGAYA
ncbi:hypothetical protein Tco_1170912, partial [Tanacetum coccineum]